MVLVSSAAVIYALSCQGSCNTLLVDLHYVKRTTGTIRPVVLSIVIDDVEELSSEYKLLDTIAKLRCRT